MIGIGIGIPSRQGGGGGGSSLTFLFKDDFITDRAPLLGRLAEPGPGTLTMVQNDGQFSTSGGKLNFPAQATSVWGDQGFYGAGLSRVVGRALVASENMATADVGGGMMLAWLRAPNLNVGGFANVAHAQYVLTVVVESQTQLLNFFLGAVAATDYKIAIILRSTGAFYFIKGGVFTNWTLAWPGNAENAATVYPAFTNYSNVGTLDSFRVTDLPAPFNSDYGLATQRLSGAVAQGATFTHTADCLLEWVEAIVNGSTGPQLAFRMQDANNYWAFSEFATNFYLGETVAGVTTTRVNAAGVLASGHRIVIVCEGTTIRGYSNNVLRFTYSTASNFATATGGNLLSLNGVPGTITDIISWPRQLTGAAATLLDDAASGNASSYLLNDDFTTPQAAPLTYNPRIAEPTGTLTVVNNDGEFSISNGKLIFPAQATPVWGDQGFYGAGLSRVVGRAIVAKVATTLSNMGFGWNDQATPVDDPRGWDNAALIIGTGVGHIGGGVSPTQLGIQIIVSGTEYSYAQVLRSAGMFSVIKGGIYTSWTLFWVNAGGVSATVYPALTNYDSSGALDTFRVTDLAAPFATDFGLATQRLAGSVATGTAFTHTADCVIEYTITVMPGGLTRVYFRTQDIITNGWFVQVLNDGNFLLYEAVAGVHTLRGNAGAVVSAGHRIVLVVDGPTIRAYSNNVLRFTYSGASSFATLTAGSMEISTTGVLSDLISWPRVLTGAAAALLDAALA